MSPAHTGTSRPWQPPPPFPVQPPRRAEWEKLARRQTSDCRFSPLCMRPEPGTVCRGWAKPAADGAEKDWAGGAKRQPERHKQAPDSPARLAPCCGGLRTAAWAASQSQARRPGLQPQLHRQTVPFPEPYACVQRRLSWSSLFSLVGQKQNNNKNILAGECLGSVRTVVLDSLC